MPDPQSGLDLTNLDLRCRVPGSPLRREGGAVKNIPLLRKALEYAQVHPEEIDFSWWAKVTPCGTTACLAGTVVILTGHEIDWERESTAGFYCRSYVTDGRRIADVAAGELGLDDDEADDLFYCQSLAQAWAVAEELTDGEIQAPPR